MRLRTLILLLAFALTVSAQTSTELSDSRKAVKTSGDVLLVAMPVATLTGVLIERDWTGLKQAAFTTATTLGATYLLKYTVKKTRPDGSDCHSFPSAHTSILFANAGFVERRYGWKLGVPAFALATYVGAAPTRASTIGGTSSWEPPSVPAVLISSLARGRAITT